MNMIKTYKENFYAAVLQLKTPNEVKRFFKDLCTPAEIKSFEERWLVANLLDEGNLSYRQINEQTGVSTTTISRVARFLSEESYQGYRLILDRLRREKNETK